MRSCNQIQTVMGATFLSVAALILYNPAVALPSSDYSLSPMPLTMLASDAAHPSSAVQHADSRQQPDQEEAQSVVIMGIIDLQDSDFTLRDSNGNIYRLDAPDKVAPFAGKYVKVTGKLRENAKLLHVETIQAIEA